MKRAAFTCFLLVGLLLVVWAILTERAESAEGGQVTFVALVNKSVTSNLPACYGPSCRGKLQEVKVHLANPLWAYGEAWLWAGGKSHHALVWRINVHADWYLWAFQGHNLWYRAVAYWSGEISDPAKMRGPALWPQVDLLPAAQCEVVAKKAMVSVASDAGTLQQPSPARYCNPAPSPSDAGGPDSCWTESRTWPDGSVITCGGRGYWLARNRYGGVWPGAAPTDAGVPPPADAQPPPGSQGSWEAPDAALYKVCPQVPVGTPCP